MGIPAIPRPHTATLDAWYVSGSIKKREARGHLKPTICRGKVSYMAYQPEPAKTAIPITCPHCKKEQFVHVAPRAGIAQPGMHTIQCVKCKGEISLTLLDQVVGDPFEAESPKP